MKQQKYVIWNIAENINYVMHIYVYQNHSQVFKNIETHNLF